MSEIEDSGERGFYPPDPEVEDATVRCEGCKEVEAASNMEMTLDSVNESADGVVLSVTRYYLCSEACAADFLFKKPGAEQ